MSFRVMRRLVPMLVTFVLATGLAHAKPDRAAVAALLQHGGAIELAGRKVDTGMLDGFYAARHYRPIWTAERRAELTAALAQAPSQGLDPAVFTVPKARPAATEILLSDVFVRYALALARGSVTMGDIDDDWAIPQPSLNPAAVLNQALRRGVAATLAALPPHAAAYERLRQAYLRYRDFTRRAAWRPITLKLPLRPGASGPGVVKLRHRLAAEDLIPDGDGPHYGPVLAAAVSQFQAARGLPSDGIVGRATLTALNIAPGARLRTIRLNLERWRAMPRGDPPTRIVVNVPAAEVTLYQEGQKSVTMRAVVGAPDHPTPVLQATVTSLLLNPPWVVPTDIAESEILPLARENPGYLAANDYSLDHGQLVQRAGPKSALGKIKFEMPNRFDVYLHDTPAKFLLTRTRRALSHGCVRLEHPRLLAERILAGDPGWTPAALDAAIATGKTRSVALPHPVLVDLVYWTAYVDANGTVEFRNDVYGRDQRLDEALVAHDLREQLPPPRTAGIGGQG